jgi:hypothetical protein
MGLARSSRRRRWSAAQRRTLGIGIVAVGLTAGVLVAEVGRVWRRGATPLPSEADDLLQAAEQAVGETVEAAVAGYREVSSRENAMFNLLASFTATFVLARGVSFLLRSRRRVGPFRDLTIGRRHIHHFVPGIILAFISGATAILSRNEDIEPRLAVGFGIGMGLTLDESALLLELDDVYWTREGLLGVEITMIVMGLLASLAFGLRFLRRGEKVLESAPAAEAQPRSVVVS